MRTVDGAPAAGHVLLLHGSEAHRVAALCAWVRHGLDRHDCLVYPRGRQDADEERLLDSLAGAEAAQRADVVAAVAAGRLWVLDAGDYYPPGRQRELVTRARADGFPGVRMFGEAITALATLGESGYAAFERESERLCSAGDVSILCTYDEDFVPRRIVVENVAAHEAGLLGDLLSAATADGSVLLTGELDAANADVLEAVLEAAATRLGEHEHLTVVLAGLSFCDVAGARALLSGSHRLRARGGRLQLVSVRPAVQRALELLGVTEFPGVVLTAAAS